MKFTKEQKQYIERLGTVLNVGHELGFQIFVASGSVIIFDRRLWSLLEQTDGRDAAMTALQGDEVPNAIVHTKMTIDGGDF